jgi:hypothetical protein
MVREYCQHGMGENICAVLLGVSSWSRVSIGVTKIETYMTTGELRCYAEERSKRNAHPASGSEVSRFNCLQ